MPISVSYYGSHKPAPGVKPRSHIDLPDNTPVDKLPFGKANPIDWMTGKHLLQLKPDDDSLSTNKTFLILMEVVGEYDDYLMCAKEGDSVFYKVWKPWLLRNTPFSGVTRDGITYATMPSGYTYAVGEVNLRRATRVSDEVVEWQTITPPYSKRNGTIPGELIYVMSLGNGTFLDINTAGRCWAVTDEPEAAT